MLQAILDGQSAIKEELKVEIQKVAGKVDQNTHAIEANGERIDKLGLQIASLEDDTPTVEEYDELEKRVVKLESQAVRS
jgi:hypothetical protein